MKHPFPRRLWRTHRRNRRLNPPQPTRAQVAQGLRNLRTLCYLEWDLAKITGDVPRKMAVIAEAVALDQALNELKEHV